jgi:hypothetical protein
MALPEPANPLCDPHHKTPEFRALSTTGVLAHTGIDRGMAWSIPLIAGGRPIALVYFNDRALARLASARGEIRDLSGDLRMDLNHSR